MKLRAVAVAALLVAVLLTAKTWWGPTQEAEEGQAPPITAQVTIHGPFPAGLVADGPYEVVDVIDGDTIKVRGGPRDQVESVRLIGIDTPETWGEDECYGPEATGGLLALLGESVHVTLVYDETQGRPEAGDTGLSRRVDGYDRLLAYVFAGDQFINSDLLRGGFAREYTYDKPYYWQEAFRLTEAEAQGGDVGLWGAC